MRNISRKKVVVSMDKKLIGILLILLLAAAFAINKSATGRNVKSNLPPQSLSSQKGRTVPDYAVNNFLFHRVVRLREKTSELQAQGQIGQKPYFPLQREAGLNEAQANALEAIALTCWQEVTRQDEKASAIIKAFQNQFPGGQVPKGGSPPPPPELKNMWEERNAMILRARDQLHAVFGEEAFARFDDYAKFHYGANKAPVSIDPVSSKSK